jgi:hypothetical protein
MTISQIEQSLIIANIEHQAKMTIKAQTTEFIVESFEHTNEDKSAEVSVIRGWLMNELETRSENAFWAWIDSGDNSPRDYFLG